MLEEIFDNLKELQKTNKNISQSSVEKILEPLQGYKFKRKFHDTLKKIAVTAIDLIPEVKVA